MRKAKLILAQVLGSLEVTRISSKNLGLGTASSSQQLQPHLGSEPESPQEQGLEKLCPSTRELPAPSSPPPAGPFLPALPKMPSLQSLPIIVFSLDYSPSNAIKPK